MLLTLGYWKLNLFFVFLSVTAFQTLSY